MVWLLGWRCVAGQEAACAVRETVACARHAEYWYRWRETKCEIIDITAVTSGETLVPSVMNALDGILRASGLFEYFSFCVTEVKIGSLGCYCW